MSVEEGKGQGGGSTGKRVCVEVTGSRSSNATSLGRASGHGNDAE